MTYELTPEQREKLESGTGLFGWATTDDAMEHLIPVVEQIVTEALAVQRDAIANAIENAPPGDRIAHMYFAEGIRSAAEIAREYDTKEHA